MKTGFKYKWVEINAFEQQPFNPQYFFDVTSQDRPITVHGAVRRGAPGSAGSATSPPRTKQFGIYFQDDWEVTDKLLLNLGLRYDYEETPSYLDYVTPADVVAGLNAVDTSPVRAPGQTYAQSLALGDVDIENYISNGNNRDAYDGAIQPRLGFSYDFSADESHVIFGGAGRAYDRNLLDYLALEHSKSTFPRYKFLFNTRHIRARRHRFATASDLRSRVTRSRQPRGAGRGEPEPRRARST